MSVQLKKILVIEEQDDVRASVVQLIDKMLNQAENSGLIEKIKSRFINLPHRSKTSHAGDIKHEIDVAKSEQEALHFIQQANDKNLKYAVVYLGIGKASKIAGVHILEHIWSIQPSAHIILCSDENNSIWKNAIKKIGKKDNLLVLQRPFDTTGRP